MVPDRQRAPGQWIGELALARDWQIRRTPLREALMVLAAEGLTVAVPRPGCQVAEMSEEDADELLPVMALHARRRRTFEAVRRASEADIRRLRRLHAQPGKHAGAKNVDGSHRANHELHGAGQAIAGNRWLDRANGDLRRVVRLLRGRQLNWPGRIEAPINEHRALLDVSVPRDARRAERLMHGHRMAPRAAPRAPRQHEGAASTPCWMSSRARHARSVVAQSRLLSSLH
jgi:DNA-binding GntR family transcriptional regulator